MVDVDKGAEGGVFVAPAPGLAGKRIIFSGTGPMDKDYEDVRGYAEKKAIVINVQKGERAIIIRR